MIRRRSSPTRSTTPYGSTSYQAVRSQTETPKRYRYTGKERDEESGLNYHGARYYAPWLGRWANCDPISLTGGLNLYRYCNGNPLGANDPTGTQPADKNQSCSLLPVDVYDPSDVDDPSASQNIDLKTIMGPDGPTKFEDAILYARSGSNSAFPVDPTGVKLATGPAAPHTWGASLTGDRLRSARAIQCTDASGANLYAWVTEEVHSLWGGDKARGNVFWSREGKLLNAVVTDSGYSMELGLGASLLNPADWISGAAAGKLVWKGGSAVVAREATASVNTAVKTAAKEPVIAATQRVPSEAVRRVHLIERMQRLVDESVRVVDDAILRGDRVVLGEFLIPKKSPLCSEVEDSLRPGEACSSSGVHV